MRDLFACFFGLWLVMCARTVVAQEFHRIGVGQAYLLNGSPRTASLADIDGEWNLRFSLDDKQTTIPAKNLIYWGQYRDRETGPQLVLIDDSVLRSDLLELSAEQVVIGDATGLSRGLWQEASVPRQALRGMMLQPPADKRARDRLLERIKQYEAADDQLLLSSGETISGLLQAGPNSSPVADGDDQPPDDNFRMLRVGEDVPLLVPAAKVAAVQFGSLGVAARIAEREPATGAWLGFRDGSLLNVRRLKTEAKQVQLILESGVELSASVVQADDIAPTFWSHITWLQPHTDEVVFLSDLPAPSYKHIPLLSLEWPYGADKNVLGGRLRSSGGIYGKGLGMHSASRLSFVVPEGFRRFEAEIALDDAASRQGSVVFKVILETAPGSWSPAYESPVIRGGDLPRTISIELEGARRIALLVDFADRGDELDYANWLMARLVK